jgi:hypothetical protein
VSSYSIRPPAFATWLPKNIKQDTKSKAGHETGKSEANSSAVCIITQDDQPASAYATGSK